ncbi:MAG: hypothetical protein ACXVB1_15590 [Pseudobdellovibrionaceae bacterium]
MKKHISGLFFLNLFISYQCLAASHFIRSGASGSTCSDWGANACPSLPTNLTRGDTYFIAGGSYSGRTFDTPTNGTLNITIQGATVANHGTDVGWNNSYSVENGNQAVWTSSLSFTTSFWVFDGSVGPIWSKSPSDFGFAFTGFDSPINIGAYLSDTTNFTISHVAATAPSGDVEKVFVQTGTQSGQTNNVTVNHSYFNGWQCVWVATTPNLPPKYQNNWLFEYNVVLNTWGSASHHSEPINNNYGTMMNQIVRYNWFEGASSGITGFITANGADNINSKTYGNVFKDLGAGNGLITGTSAGNLVSPQVYNNTVINFNGWWIGGSITGTPLIYNNLLYNMSASAASPGDYNAYYSCTNVPSEAHGQIASGVPFVNLSTDDLRLIAPTQAGYSLSTEFGQDVLGHSRGADGVWDRGAYEFVSGGTLPQLLAPQNLRIASL